MLSSLFKDIEVYYCNRLVNRDAYVLAKSANANLYVILVYHLFCLINIFLFSSHRKRNN